MNATIVSIFRFPSGLQPAHRLAGGVPRHAVELQQLVQRLRVGRRHRRQSCKVHRVDLVEPDSPVEEGGDGDLVGGVEDGRGARRCPQALPRQSAAPESARDGRGCPGPRRSCPPACGSRARRPRIRRDPAMPARRRSARACPACPVAPRPTRRGTAPSNGSRSADGSPPPAAPAAARTGSGPRSPRAPCSSSSPNRPRSCGPSPSWDGRRPLPASRGASVAGSRVRNGPPEAVRMIFSTRPAQVPGSSGSDWKMAECSLSIGSSVAPPSCTARMNRSPPTTSASLLASSSRLPARAAARQDESPAAPTIAAITRSTCSWDATSSSAAWPHSTFVRSPALRTRPARSSAADSLAITANAGVKRRHCCSNSSTRVAALSANTSKRSGWRATTSSVLAPIEPVAPRTATRRFTMRRPPASSPAARSAARRRPDRGPRRGRGAGRWSPSCRRCA